MQTASWKAGCTQQECRHLMMKHGDETSGVPVFTLLTPKSTDPVRVGINTDSHSNRIERIQRQDSISREARCFERWKWSHSHVTNGVVGGRQPFIWIAGRQAVLNWRLLTVWLLNASSCNIGEGTSQEQGFGELCCNMSVFACC